MAENRHHDSLGMRPAAPAEGSLPLARRRMVSGAGRIALAIGALLVLGAATTVIGRVLRFRDLQASTAEQARTWVSVAAIEPAKGGETLDLPGTLQGYIESPIYARTSGYVLRWLHDIGDRVQKGEVLAELDTPEVDEQLAQARAARAQAASSLELARTSAERWENLRQRDAVSQQELDERRSAYGQARANLEAAEANVQRLQHLEEFKHIVAPFAGVVTRRNVDVGDLVDAGNGGSARALFLLSQSDPLRVYVYVPQSYAGRIKVGQEVTVRQAEMPSGGQKGTIHRTAGAIDSSTRTLQVEVSLPNPEARMLPGAYVQVSIPTGRASNPVAPSNSLLFRPEGMRLPLVDSAGKVRLQAVTVGRDFGQTIEILSGVANGDRVVLNPPDSIAEGDIVSVRPAEPAAGTAPR